MSIDDKTMEMIQSGDREMVILGLIILLDKGEEWIVDNIPSFGTYSISTQHIYNRNGRAINMKVRNISVCRGNIAIHSRNGLLDARYIYDNEFGGIKFEKI